MILQAAAELGIRSVRLTGGEPLVRPDLPTLVELLSQVEGIDDISLTTNATLLAKYATGLKVAGLNRVNISLDTFKPDRFRHITGSDKLGDVLAGIEAAMKAGLHPIKINMVVLKGINDDELPEFAQMSLSDGWHVRFIEHMPMVAPWAEADQLVAVGDMMETIQRSIGQLEPCLVASGTGPAKYYRLPGAEGTIGFIGALTDCFCSQCNRLRLTADGRLRPCLLADDEVDIKGPLRSGASIDDLKRFMQEAAALKGERHKLGQGFIPSKRQMWQIGG